MPADKVNQMQALVVLSVLSLALLGRMPDSAAGWITCPPRVVMIGHAHVAVAGCPRRTARPGRHAAP